MNLTFQYINNIITYLPPATEIFFKKIQLHLLINIRPDIVSDVLLKLIGFERIFSFLPAFRPLGSLLSAFNSCLYHTLYLVVESGECRQLGNIIGKFHLAN